MELSKLPCLTFLCTVLPLLHLCHLMSASHFNPNETVNSPITGMEMCIVTQPKVATGKLLLAPQISGKSKDVATFKSSQAGSQQRSHNEPNCRCCFGTEKHHNLLSTFFLFPPPSWISSNLPAHTLRQQHFCMEQQLQHLCEGRPLDVLCVDNTQKCSIQAGSRREGERQQGRIEKERNKDSYRSSCSYSHE